jgi:hypothetical protein
MPMEIINKVPRKFYFSNNIKLKVAIEKIMTGVCRLQQYKL